MALSVLFFHTNTGQRTFLARGSRLWNDLARNFRGLSTFENELDKKIFLVILKMTILLLTELFNF